ncbi:UNVERIFIED_CONTAM: hypothetical protein Sangu_2073100 [Sesamum angustifolium]|uniref:Uncharacterized protein n=1 Tax=Sesamum angustifolium TaxID=2727405 RepID=A0AAW2LJ92_9LAMI
MLGIVEDVVSPAAAKLPRLAEEATRAHAQGVEQSSSELVRTKTHLVTIRTVLIKHKSIAHGPADMPHAMRFLPSALNVKVKKFNQARPIAFGGPIPTGGRHVTIRYSTGITELVAAKRHSDVCFDPIENHCRLFLARLCYTIKVVLRRDSVSSAMYLICIAHRITSSSKRGVVPARPPMIRDLVPIPSLVIHAEKTGQAMDTMKDKAQATKDKASQAADSARGRTHDAKDQTGSYLDAAKDKASQTAQATKEKASEMAESGKETAQAGKERTGGFLQKTGDK